MEQHKLFSELRDVEYDPFAPEKTGTTLLALKYDGGIICCTDSLTSGRGLAVNPAAQKLTRLSDHMMLMRAGSVSHTQYVAQMVKSYLESHRVELSSGTPSRVVKPTVKAAASILRQIVYQNRYFIQGGFILAGYDDRSGLNIFMFDRGLVLERQWASIGSGSGIVTVIMDAEYKPGMSQTEAISLAQKAVTHAIQRDRHSSGMVRWAVIEKSTFTTNLLPSNTILTLEQRILGIPNNEESGIPDTGESGIPDKRVPQSDSGMDDDFSSSDDDHFC